MPEPALRLEQLVSGYVRGLPIVRGISLALAPGEILAVLGPNGAGKSTLVKAIAGIAPIFGGQILHDGRAIHGAAIHTIARGGIGYVPQVNNVFAEMTVRENLELGLTMRAGRPGPLLADMFDLFPDLARLGRQRAGTLSGGQRQMASIARALLGRPSLLMLDEPSAGLAPIYVTNLFAALRSLKQRTSILLVEQNVRAALACADRAVVLAEGQIRLDRPASALLSTPALSEIFLGAAS